MAVRSGNAAVTVLLSGLLVTSAFFAGCGEDETSAKLREISGKVTLLTSAGQQMISVEARRFVALREVRDELDKLVKATSGNTAAMRLLQGRVQEQMGHVVAALAAEKEQEAVYLGMAVLNSTDLYRRQASISAAAAKVSLAEDIARLGKDKGEVDKRVADLSSQKAALTSKIDATQKQIDEKAAQSKKLREEEGKMRNASIGGTATAALESAERAAAVNRRADELDREAAYLAAENATLVPEVKSIDGQIAGLREASTRVEAAAKSLADRQSLVRAESVDTGAQATETGARVTAAADALLKLHAAEDGGGLKGRLEQLKAGGSAETDGLRDAVKDASLSAVLSLAESYFTAAGASAKQLGADTTPEQRKSGQQADASVQQALADLNLLKARSKERLAEAMRAAATLEPALAKSSSYAAFAEDAAKQAGEAMTAARTAYGELKEKVAGFGGDEKKLERLTKQLDKLAKGETAPAPAPKADPAAAAAAAASGVPEEVMTLLREYIEIGNSGELSKALPLFHYKNDREKAGVETLTKFVSTMLTMDQACTEKFGKPLSAVLKADPMAAQMAAGLSMMDGLKDLKLKESDFKVTLGSDSKTAAAKASIAGVSAVQFQLVDGKWKLLPPADMLATAAGPTGAMMAPIQTAFSEVATDLKGGKFATEKEFAAALVKKMQEQMAKMMGGGK